MSVADIPSQIFHLAIPCNDLSAAETFYVEQLGCTLGRKYPSHITLNFFQAQVVCHLTDEVIEDVKMYPRHFGVTFQHKTEFDAVLSRAESLGLPFFQKPFVRFAGTPAEHHSFFLIDPSNNLLELNIISSQR